MGEKDRVPTSGSVRDRDGVGEEQCETRIACLHQVLCETGKG